MKNKNIPIILTLVALVCISLLVVILAFGEQTILPTTTSEDAYYPKKPQQLTFGENQYTNLTWSLDGRKIAFTGFNPESSTTFLLTIDVASKKIDEFAQVDGSVSELMWSPDGLRIAFCINQLLDKMNYNVLGYYSFIDKKVHRITKLQRSSLWPLWANDGNKLVVMEQRADESPSMRFVKGIVSVEKEDMFALGTIPDLKVPKAVFTDDNNNIWMSDYDWTNAKRLTFQGQYYSVALSPDEKKIAYIGGDNLYWMDIATLKPTKVGKGSNPTWSKDSDKIAYQIIEYADIAVISSDIWVVSIDGLKQLFHAYGTEPVWSPAKDELAYIANGNVFIIRINP